MKHLTKLLMLTALAIFVSCQNEQLTESQSLEETTIDNLDTEGAVDEGEEVALDFNAESEKLVTPSKASLFAKGSSSCTPDLEALELSLPETVSLKTTANPGYNAYFDFEILDTDLAAADLKGWCIDVDGYLEVEGPYDFSVYSSYEDISGVQDAKGNPIVENMDKFDEVNWILNQDFVGKVSPISGETYTYGMIQWAIWQLLDDQNCRNCYYLTGDVKDGWKQNSDALEAVAMEIVDAALENGQDFVPGCGEKVALIFVANDFNPQGQVTQSIIYTVDVPEKEEECSDCEGKVTELELEFDWRYAKRVKVYQKKENSCYGVKLFDQTVQPGETFTLNGANSDGTFGEFVYIYIGNSCYYYTKIKTNCYLKIGPGYEKGVFNVVSGRSSEGGKLCEYVKPEYNCWKYRYWGSYYYSKYRYQNHGY